MRIVLHVGHGKTGTTSIQNTMRKNAAALRTEHSLNYPDFAANHWLFAVPFAVGGAPVDVAESGPEVEARARAVLAGLETELPRHAMTVLSSEQFFFLDAGTLQRIDGYLRERGHDVRVLAYVRHPLGLVTSTLAEQIKTAKRGLGEPLFLGDFVTPGLQRLVATFGRERITIRRFGQRYFTGGDLLDDFTAAVSGAPLPVERVRKNDTLSLPALQIAAGMSAIRRGAGRSESLAAIAGPPFVLPRDCVERVMEAWAPGLEYLATVFGVRFEETIDPDAHPAAPNPGIPEATARSLAALLMERQPSPRPAAAPMVEKRRPSFWTRMLGHRERPFASQAMARVGRRS